MFSGFRKIKQINTFHAIIILSIIYTEKWLSSNRLSVISVLVKIFRKFIVQGMYHCDIHPDSFASLDAISTCRMPHPYLIVVHQTARIQDNAVIFHNVTIGVIEDGSAPHAAQLGKNVYIGTGASLLGNMNIGDNVRIGANSLIIKKSVPSDTTVVGLYK